MYDIADDLSYKSKENYTLRHFQERINIYAEEEFDIVIEDADVDNFETIQDIITYIDERI